MKIIQNIVGILALFFLASPVWAQVPVSLSPVARMQFLNSSGTPLSGGFVYTYISGTSTPLASYTDATGTIQNTNPLVLDSGGFGELWLQSSGVYRIKVTDANNVQQYVVDGISGPPNLLAPGPIGTSVPNVVESTAFTSATSLPALSGIVRLASGDGICWRNNANSGDLCLTKSVADALQFNGGGIPFSTTPNEWTMTQTFDVTAIFNQTTGAPPFTVASTTNVPNLNASTLLGFNWAVPGTIGSTTPNTGAFTTLNAGTSFVLNGSQAVSGVQGSTGTKLQAAGTNSNTVNAPLCDDANGNATTTCTLQINGPFCRATSLDNTAIPQGSNTNILHCGVAIPATGGPFRIMASYSLFASSGNANNGMDAWVSDGSNTWAPCEFYQNSGQNGSVPTCGAGEVSSTTYAAGAGTITITVIATDNHSGSSMTAVTAALAGPGVSHLNAEVLVSN